MKKCLLILLIFGSLSSHGRDIKFDYEGKMVSLSDVYYADEDYKIDRFFELITNKNGSDISSSMMCIETDREDFVLSEISDLSDELDGPFEEVMIYADVSNSFAYPITIELYDAPNEWSLGSVNVQFCK